MSKHRHEMQKKSAGGKMHKRAMGGSMKEHEYNAVGSPEMKESHEKESGFKKGGKAKKKAGGKVEHGKSHKRMDKKPRRAAGGPVYSSASKKTVADKSEAGQGHEGDGPKGEDPDRGCYAKGGKVKWIQGLHKGALHRALHVPEGEKIPEKKMEKASHSENPRIRKMVSTAKTLKKIRG